MKTILVDDMLLDLQLFELKCADMPDFEIVGKFTDPDQAIAYAAGHVVDFALLDIDMPGMNGMELAQRLRQIRGDIIIVFATAHPKFAVDALRMKADYMIFKPFDREDIADVMERAKLLRRRQSKRFFFRTFGSFDMLVDGEPVRFRSAKAKELMALCLYRQGCPVSIHEIVECLWGEEAAGADSTGYRRTIKELTDTLRDCAAEELILRARGSLQLRLELVDSDYQRFLEGDEDAICHFQGDFLRQYSWAEPMIYTLQEKKQLMLARLSRRDEHP
ncbi:response regulator [Dysosmobacter sp.]|uniref:response regulator n=1 Tax=Dysosmobacter sp. TaxID=2591382 RepID=UPI003AB2123A